MIKKILPLILILASCSSIPKIQSFKAADGEHQFYLRASKFESENEELDLDITYRTNKFSTWNFTIKSQGIDFSKVDSCTVEYEYDTSSEIKKLDDLEILFLKRNESIYRYTTQMDPQFFIKIIDAKDVNLYVYNKGSKTKFNSTKSFKATLGEFKNEAIY